MPKIHRIARIVRTHTGQSQVDFAKQLGVTERTVQAWESGTSVPKAKHLNALLIAFDQIEKQP